MDKSDKNRILEGINRLLHKDSTGYIFLDSLGIKNERLEYINLCWKDPENYNTYVFSEEFKRIDIVTQI